MAVTKTLRELGWELETVDDIDYTGYWSSLYLDSNDYPHIAYSSFLSGTEQILYSEWNGASWTRTVLSPSSIPAPLITDYYTVSAAWDSSGYAHIAYCDGSDNLIHAYYNGASWGYETITATTSGAKYVKMAIDSTNKLHIVYLDVDADTLKYASGTLSSWSIEDIASTSGYYYYPDIVIDSNDKPHVSYIERVPGSSPYEYSLEYGKRLTGSWSIETAYTGVYTGVSTAIDIDSNNKPHIIFASKTYVHGYTEKTGASWALSWLIEGINWSYSLDIAIDSDDNPHLFLPDGSSPPNLTWMYYDGSDWYYDTIEQTGEYGLFAIVASPSAIYLSYQKYGRSKLKYAKIACGKVVVGDKVFLLPIGNFTGNMVALKSGKASTTDKALIAPLDKQATRKLAFRNCQSSVNDKVVCAPIGGTKKDLLAVR